MESTVKCDREDIWIIEMSFSEMACRESDKRDDVEFKNLKCIFCPVAVMDVWKRRENPPILEGIRCLWLLEEMGADPATVRIQKKRQAARCMLCFVCKPIIIHGLDHHYSLQVW